MQEMRQIALVSKAAMEHIGDWAAHVSTPPRRVLSQSLMLGQNLEMGYQSCNDLQTPKLPRTPICGKTSARQWPLAVQVVSRVVSSVL
jgi:hypothetical protein